MRLAFASEVVFMPPLHHVVTLLAILVAVARSAPEVDARTAARIKPGERKIGVLTPSIDARALVAPLAGAGVVLSNARYTGSARAAGSFEGAMASLGVDSGVVLSTGDIQDIQGPNDTDEKSTDLETTGDSQLALLVAPYATFDAAILEFDLVTASPTISIRYVFASEEYNEYVDSLFNDVVAIDVNGANCANVGGRPVSVNTINGGSNPSLYFDNTNGLRDTQLDGMTVPLDCTAAVVPNQVNRIRIAIADVSDARLDAAVFLPAGGIRSPGIGAPTLGDTVKAIEYFHPGFGHYFITTIPGEIASLDSGHLSAAWDRTGEAFDVYAADVAGTVPVCRFFSAAFAPRSSHFYTPSVTECDIVKTDPVWTFEGEVFNMRLPRPDGICGDFTKELFRLYNNGAGGAPNHRYTTELFVRDQMLARGWTPEGLGVGVVACVPDRSR